MHRRTTAIVLAVLCAIAASPIVARSVLTHEPILTKDVNEWAPRYQLHDGEATLAWYQNRKGHRRERITYVRTGDDTPVRLSIPGSYGYTATLAGSRAFYQQINESRDGSRVSWIYRRDLNGSNARLLSSLARTGGWLWRPSYSDGRLLYGENRFDRPKSPWSIMLWSGGQRIDVLDRVTNRCACIVPGQLNGGRATWIHDENVIRYEVKTSSKARPPIPDDRYNYTSALDADGSVYFVQANRRCGVNAQLWRWDLDGTRTLIHDFPGGTEPATLFAFDEQDGSTTLFLDDVDCSTGRVDAYRAANVDTATEIMDLHEIGRDVSWTDPGTTRSPEDAGSSR